MCHPVHLQYIVIAPSHFMGVPSLRILPPNIQPKLCLPATKTKNQPMIMNMAMNE